MVQENRAELGLDIDINKYIAGAVVVFDLHQRSVLWVQHLDLSMDHTQYRAYIYASPTLADLDADGKLEVIVGTSMVLTFGIIFQGSSFQLLGLMQGLHSWVVQACRFRCLREAGGHCAHIHGINIPSQRLESQVSGSC